MNLISEQFNEKPSTNYDVRVMPIEVFETDTRTNIDIQVATAKRFPRNITNVLKNILEYAQMDKETAENCFYALKRDGKVIRGASIRLAELIASCYGNIRTTARIINNDGKTVTAQGICWDLQNNVAYSVEVIRKITNKEGKTFSEDMQVITSNAACAIAMRNAIFKCVPNAITGNVQQEIKKVMMGEEKDFTTIRKNAVQYFEKQGVSLKSILTLFEKRTIEELTTDDVFDLRGIATGIKEGDTTIEQVFSIAPKSNPFGKASKILSIPKEATFSAEELAEKGEKYIEENQEIVKEEQIKIELPKGTTLEGRN
jgi:hypothetical protein